MSLRSHLAAVLCAVSTLVTAQTPRWRVLNLSDGLPDNNVVSVLKDSEGFVWMGTRSGLCRYDGTEFRMYRHIEGDPSSLPANAVDALSELPGGRLWVRAGHSSYIMDRRTGEFSAPPLPSAVDCFHVDEDSVSWVMSAKECFRIGTDGDVTKVDISELPSPNITSLSSCGRLLLTLDQNGALGFIDKTSLKAERTEDHIPATEGESRSIPFDSYTDSRSRIWIFSSEGLWAYDYTRGMWLDSLTSRWKGSIVHSVVEDTSGRIWIGKEVGGIDILDPSTGEVLPVPPDGGDFSFPDNSVTSLYRDKEDVIWSGTYRKGVAYTYENMFLFYPYHVGDITCVLPLSGSRALLGDNDGNVKEWHSGEDPSSVKMLYPSLGLAVTSLLMDHSGRLWVGTFMDGLYCIENGRKKRFNTSNGLSDDSVWALAEDPSGNIWIGTLGGGLQKYDGTFTTFKADYTGIRGDYISSLAIRDGKELVIGFADSEVDIMDLSDNSFRRMLSPEEHLAGMSINQVFVDSRSLVWAGTNAGINVWDGKRIVDLPDDFSLKSEYISGISEDSFGDIWVVTGSRLVRVEARDGTFTQTDYPLPDYLLEDGFNLRSMACLDDGSIVVGKVDGLVSFSPSELLSESVRGHVLFVDRDTKATFRLPFSQKVFSAHVMTDRYDYPVRPVFEYRLGGEWIGVEGNLVTLTNLYPGSYDLVVRIAGTDTVSEPLHLVVEPPFWRSLPAILIYVLALLGLVGLLALAFMRREREKFHIRQLEEDSRRTEEVFQMKERFFTNVSHDLRTPLTLIISPLDEMVSAETDPAKKSSLQMISRNANRLLGLVNQLLDFRKSEMAAQNLSLEDGDVVQFLRETCDSFGQISEGRDIPLSFFSTEETLSMAFDRDKLGKVMMNLLSNAFKFTPDGGRVEVFLYRTGGTLEIRVCDTGIGIPDSEKSNIFKRFYQVGNSTQGTGIGLSLVHDFVSLHGGEVSVHDNIGGGSVFVVKLPIRQHTVSETESLVEEEVRDLPAVLVVDDSADFREFMSNSLRLQYRVLQAENGEQALQMINDEAPDLVLSDVMMPVMDGNELCQRIKSDPLTTNIPVILLTAKAGTESVVEGLKTGADDYVTKPFNMTVLLLRIGKLIERTRLKKSGLLDPTPEEIVITPVDEQLVGKAVQYVEDRMSDPQLSVEDLASHMGMARVTLYKKLLQITGKAPLEFIRTVRMKRAAQLLRESQMRVSEIAYSVGYNNPKIFAKHFKDEFGMLPSTYQGKFGNKKV